jgi:hypothetical protein
MRPRLYIDIDGVLYAHYGGEWQLRPYIVTFTRWAKKHFDIYWVSYNSHAHEVVASSYAAGEVVGINTWTEYTTDDKGFKIPVEPTWHPKALHSGKLKPIHNTGGLQGEWFLIENTPPNVEQTEILDSLGQFNRWIVVPDTGSDVLLDLKVVFEEYIATGKLNVPYEWATRSSRERDLSLTAPWNGFGRHKKD